MKRTKVEKARENVTAFIDDLLKSRGLDHEVITARGTSTREALELTVSDLRALVSAANPKKDIVYRAAVKWHKKPFTGLQMGDRELVDTLAKVLYG